MAWLRAITYSRTLRLVERSTGPPTARSDDLALLARRVDLVAFPQIVMLVLVLLWNLITAVQTTDCLAPAYYCKHYRVTPDVLHADPRPSPVPDSGNLHPVRCIIPQPSLLPPVLVPDNHISRSPSELTVRPSIRRQRLWLHKQQTPRQKLPNRYRDKGRGTASTPRSHTTTVIPRAQRLPKIRQHPGSWTASLLAHIVLRLVELTLGGADLRDTPLTKK